MGCCSIRVSPDTEAGTQDDTNQAPSLVSTTVNLFEKETWDSLEGWVSGFLKGLGVNSTGDAIVVHNNDHDRQVVSVWEVQIK